VTEQPGPAAEGQEPSAAEPQPDDPVEEPEQAPEQEPVADADPLQAAKEEIADLQTQLVERTADLQRLQAEFVNYKRRVDRDRELVQQNATYRALSPIVEVLDTIDRAREHGPLDGGLKAVAEQLERAVAGAGLTKFGAVGDAFDPTVHEALSHIGEDPEVSVTTCKVIAKSGYRIGDRVARAAQVLVVDPPSGAAEQPLPEEEAAAEAPAEPQDAAEPVDVDEFAEPGETRDEEVHQEE
jgi:molecular chaperone GrpE